MIGHSGWMALVQQKDHSAARLADRHRARRCFGGWYGYVEWRRCHRQAMLLARLHCLRADALRALCRWRGWCDERQAAAVMWKAAARWSRRQQARRSLHRWREFRREGEQAGSAPCVE